jgi:hypothetical protein
MDGPIYFADVVFADIFTSYAKVLGDVWLSGCMLLPGNTLFRTPADGPWLRWVMPTIMRCVVLSTGVLKEPHTKTGQSSVPGAAETMRYRIFSRIK